MVHRRRRKCRSVCVCVCVSMCTCWMKQPCAASVSSFRARAFPTCICVCVLAKLFLTAMSLLRSWRVWLFHSLIMVVLNLYLGDAHPQCLDYRPPFQPQESLLFCKEYAKFGCCDRERDDQISRRFYQIMEYFDHSGFMACGKYIRNILCQVSLPLGILLKGCPCVAFWALAV